MLASVQELTAVLQRVAQRDRAAFKILYDATSPKLYGIILRILSRRDLADEVLQEVYVKIWEHAGDYKAGVASPITWMATIARNRALDLVRRRQPIQLDNVPDIEQFAAAPVDPLADRERSEDLARLLSCLNGLDAEKREMVVQAYLRGSTRSALAIQYGRPEATIKTWLRRSLAQLKDCLSQ